MSQLVKPREYLTEVSGPDLNESDLHFSLVGCIAKIAIGQLTRSQDRCGYKGSKPIIVTEVRADDHM